MGLARPAAVLAVFAGVLGSAHACAPFGLETEAQGTGDASAGDRDTTQEPPKPISDASVYDGPVLEGGSVLDAGRCTSSAGPAMVELTVGDAKYCIDSTEVTNAQYEIFLQAIAAGTTPEQPTYCAFNISFAPSCLGGGGPSVAAGAPVNCVDWCDAYAFCKWAGKRLCGRIGGGSVGLGERDDPARSQWFAACTRGGARRYAYGDDFDSEACASDSAEPAQVGSHPRCEGGFAGLFDLTGNVSEWEDGCEGTSGAEDPCRRRGGDILDDPLFQTCDQDYALTRASRYPAGGFRCCKD